jgi:hypothetical protein
VITVLSVGDDRLEEKGDGRLICKFNGCKGERKLEPKTYALRLHGLRRDHQTLHNATL